MLVVRNKFQASGSTCWIVFEQDAVVLAWTPREDRKNKPLSVLNGLWVHCLRWQTAEFFVCDGVVLTSQMTILFSEITTEHLPKRPS